MTRKPKWVFSEYLVIAAQGGDRDALARLVALWQPDLLRHAARLTDDADGAGDALQEAWLDIVRGLARLRSPAVFPAWAYRIVTRKCAAQIRGRQAVRRTAAALTAEPGERATDGAGDAERAADLAAIRLAMAGLPPDQRIALALHHQDGFTVAEIAVALAVPEGTVKTRLMHARRKLAAIFDPDRKGTDHDTQ